MAALRRVRMEEFRHRAGSALKARFPMFFANTSDMDILRLVDRSITASASFGLKWEISICFMAMGILYRGYEGVNADEFRNLVASLRPASEDFILCTLLENSFIPDNMSEHHILTDHFTKL